MVAQPLLAFVHHPVISLPCDVTMASASPNSTDDVHDGDTGPRQRRPTSTEAPVQEQGNTNHAVETASDTEQIGIIQHFAQQEWVRNVIVFRGDFVVDPQGDAVYLWMGIVAAAVIYNVWAVILRIAFTEMRQQFLPWLCFTLLDVMADFVYIMDVALQFRMGYLEDGILVHDPMKLAMHYMRERNMCFVKDVTAALPIPSLLLIFAGLLSFIIPQAMLYRDGVTYPISRLPKLMKFHSISRFISATDMKTNSPNVHQACKLLVYLATTIHWIGCFYYIITEYEGIGSNEWVIQSVNNSIEIPFHRKYLRSVYWSTMTLTTIGATWGDPQTDIEYLFTGFTFLIGVFMFATVVGNVGDVISKMNAARADYQQKMDVIKIYMRHHNIPEVIQNRVKKWAEYTWNRTQAMDDQSMLDILPLRLRAEIATHVHLETLQKVRIFEECEKGLLCELVVRLRTQIYSPGDYICRKGEIGREMYIINHGRVEVVISNHEGDCTVVARLTEGNYFGEISLLKLDDGCNRRNADVRSVGYSELLVLSKRDLMQSLVEYPEARRGLEKQARDRMKEFKEKMRMEKIRAEQKLRIHNPDVYSNDGDEFATLGSALQNKRVKEREMSELRHVIKELRSFDSQVSKKQLQLLKDEVQMLKSEVSSRDREIMRLRRRSVRGRSRAQSNDDIVFSNSVEIQVNGDVTYSTSDVDIRSNHKQPIGNSCWNHGEDNLFVDLTDTHGSARCIHPVESWVTEHALPTPLPLPLPPPLILTPAPELTQEIIVPGISINDIVEQEPHLVQLPLFPVRAKQLHRTSIDQQEDYLFPSQGSVRDTRRRSGSCSSVMTGLSAGEISLDDLCLTATDDDSVMDGTDRSDSDF